jgi:hypothetical protein
MLSAGSRASGLTNDFSDYFTDFVRILWKLRVSNRPLCWQNWGITLAGEQAVVRLAQDSSVLYRIVVAGRELGIFADPG